MRSPTDASLPPLRASAHGSGSMRIATPSSCRTSTDYSLPVSPAHCERFGTAARLKAGSHPIGGRDSVVTTGDETVEVCLGASGKRLPLLARSTETTSALVLRAAPAPLTAAAKLVTARQPRTPITAMFLAARRPITAVLFAS